VNTVLAESFEPMFVGGRIGLLGAGLASLGALGIHLMRRKR
jgi:hypothetical protein